MKKPSERINEIARALDAEGYESVYCITEAIKIYLDEQQKDKENK